jgi:hypothetical protein
MELAQDRAQRQAMVLAVLKLWDRIEERQSIQEVDEFLPFDKLVSITITDQTWLHT